MLSSSMVSGLNIAALSRRTGVAADTLRKWEQRYGVLRPQRTPGGQRRYDEADVARVHWLRDRLAEGYRIGEAAALLGGTIPTESPAELREALLAAVREAEVGVVGALLDQAFALGPLEETMRDVVHPLLVRVGEGWESGELSVAQEHLLSQAVRSRLDRLLADARGGVHGVVVLACAPGERHELGLLTLAVLLRADGWQVAYLGPDTPVAEALLLAEALGARAVCFSVAVADRLADLDRSLAEVRLPADCTLVLGGAAVTDERARKLGALYVDGNLPRAVRALRKLAA